VSRRFGDDVKAVELLDEKSLATEAVAEKISPAQRQAYQQYEFTTFNNSFTKATSQETWRISGRFSTEQRRSIGFIRSGENAERKPVFKEGHIDIYGVEDIRRGYLFRYNEDDALWDSSKRVGDICIHLDLNQSQIKAAIEETTRATQANGPPRVKVDLYVLAFQSEVERSLSEHHHSQTFWFKDGAFAPAILERLTILPAPPKPAAPTSGNGKAKTSSATTPISTAATGNAVAQPRYSNLAL
jgi:hypothetical protein